MRYRPGVLPGVRQKALLNAATLDVHVYGTLAMIRAFAPVLGGNGGGAILNVLSNLSWLSYDGNNAYAVAKSAQWSLTNGVRLELAGQGTLVSGVIFGPTATETMRTHASDAVMNDPVDIVRTALDGIEAGTTEIIADRFGAEAKAALSWPPCGFVLQTVAHGSQEGRPTCGRVRGVRRWARPGCVCRAWRWSSWVGSPRNRQRRRIHVRSWPSPWRPAPARSSPGPGIRDRSDRPSAERATAARHRPGGSPYRRRKAVAKAYSLR